MRRDALPVKLTIRQAYFELSVDHSSPTPRCLGRNQPGKQTLLEMIA